MFDRIFQIFFATENKKPYEIVIFRLTVAKWLDQNAKCLAYECPRNEPMPMGHEVNIQE